MTTDDNNSSNLKYFLYDEEFEIENKLLNSLEVKPPPQKKKYKEINNFSFLELRKKKIIIISIRKSQSFSKSIRKSETKTWII